MDKPPSPIPDEIKSSPMMQQWQTCKEMAGTAVLLFRMGDFYEAFYEDAALLSRELDLSLTKRQDVPMSGIPQHTCDLYIDKLVAKGFRVAVAEQIGDPKKTKGLVKREIVRFVTPGTIINSQLLSDKSNNFFVSVNLSGKIFGLACLDLTTGEFVASEFTEEKLLLNEIYRLNPSELLCSEKFKEKHSLLIDSIRQSTQVLVNTQPEWHFDQRSCYDFLTGHFAVFNLDGFGLQGMASAINAAGALLRYIRDNLSLPIQHVQDIRTFSTQNYMSIDQTTLRNLELTQALHGGGKKNTLLSVLDHTHTAMGARLIQQIIKQPLLSLSEIHNRQGAISCLLDNEAILSTFRDHLICIKDIERLIMRASSGYATARDIVALHRSFDPVPVLKETLFALTSPWIVDKCNKLDPLTEMNQLISQALVDEPPLRIGEGKVFRDGYHSELDELRAINQDGKTWIANYQTQLRDETGIKTLKVGYNRLFGYYIEVSKGQTEKMPATFIRRQTLANAERYISPVLKDYETKVLTAQERIESIESELFLVLREKIATFLKPVMRVAGAIAWLDCLCSLAEAARINHYCCPIVDESNALIIEEGRHPIVEQVCKRERFIPNDIHLDGDSRQLMLITGPNMAGKSTYLRQVALISIMAQIGAFVPARRAHIGLIDKVFSRIGASDDLSKGQSTFMVEMTEAANILHHASSRSLVILDEIGRGTSTYDGISIAWSIAEYLLTTEDKRAKTLFATHYWELTKLQDKLHGAINYNVAVHEAAGEITFLRKIVEGGTDKSYGIHVARLAGMPATVIERSKEILEHLEENANQKSAFEPSTTTIKRPSAKKIKVPHSHLQLSLFDSL